MGQSYRHELKFICSQQDLLLLENQIRFLCPLDAHTGPEASYNIRSIYFDSLENDAYYENENGDNDRAKFRIRIYDYSDQVIKLERKSSHNGLKHKESCTLTREQCDSLLHGDEMIPGEGHPLLNSFLAQKCIQPLLPKVTVDYNRTPYVYPIGNVRITFDRNIRSSSYIDLFQKDIPSRPILPLGAGLLEVKYDEVLPGAILEILREDHELHRTTFSKYYLCRSMTI